jgi:APA family basic amino acid/polyamine antiporter
MRVRRPDLARPFKTPWVPFVPIMGILISLALMGGLKGLTWLRLIIWLVIGMVIYFTYGVKHSRVRTMPQS